MCRFISVGLHAFNVWCGSDADNNTSDDARYDACSARGAATGILARIFFSSHRAAAYDNSGWNISGFFQCISGASGSDADAKSNSRVNGHAIAHGDDITARLAASGSTISAPCSARCTHVIPRNIGPKYARSFDA